MKVSTIAYLGLSTLLLGLMPTPAMGVTIDLFNSVVTDSDPSSPSPNYTGYTYASPNTYGDTDTITFDDIDFDVQQVSRGSSSDTGSRSDQDTGLTSTDVIGETRFIRVELNSSGLTPIQSGTATLKVDPDAQNVSLSTDNGKNAGIVIKWYGSSGSLGGVDLTDGVGSQIDNSLLLNIDSIDQDVTLNFVVTDSNNNTGNLTENIDGAGDYYFNYSQAPDVDFESINSIELNSSNEPNGLDFSFDFIQSAQEVPFEFSPGLGLILGGSFFGLNSLRKKLKANN